MAPFLQKAFLFSFINFYKDVIKDMKQHTLVMEHWIKPAVIYMTGNFKIQVF